MAAGWNSFCQVVGDALLGWSLRLPSDLTLLVVAALSAAVFTTVRWVTTDQNRLRRAKADKKQLKRLAREAKHHEDPSALARHRATLGQIGLLTLRAELRPLLAAIGPIAVLATWCAYRLQFHPPREGDPIRLAVYTPVSATGSLIHLVPEQGITSDGWIKQIDALTNGGPSRGLATWTLAAQARDNPYRLTVRFGSEVLQHDLLVGSPVYSPPLIVHGKKGVSQLQYEPVKLFGLLPGMPSAHLPPWLVAYLVLTIPLVFALRALLRIH